jgi:hypothetical protein
MGSGLFQISTEGNTFSIMRKIGGVYIALLILQYNESLNLTRVIAPGEFRPGSIGGLQNLTLNETLTARSMIASNLIIDSTSTVNCNIGNSEGYMVTRDGNQLDSYYQRSQTGSTLFLCRNTLYPVQCGNSLFIGDISFSDDASSHQLAVAGKAVISGDLKALSVSAETLTINTPSIGSGISVVGELGSSFSFLRVIHGHHLDCYNRDSGSSRVLYLNHYANAGVRVPRLGINGDPSDVHLDCRGNARFSGAVTASNFPSSSDARLKTEVEPVSLEECTRLVKAITPCTYKRLDMEGNPARVGYIAQHLDAELSAGFRSILGSSSDESGPLLTVDYSRVCTILHGCLRSCLARIEALESRLQ